jgi:hypothetical protein
LLQQHDRIFRAQAECFGNGYERRGPTLIPFERFDPTLEPAEQAKVFGSESAVAEVEKQAPVGGCSRTQSSKRTRLIRRHSERSVDASYDRRIARSQARTPRQLNEVTEAGASPYGAEEQRVLQMAARGVQEQAPLPRRPSLSLVTGDGEAEQSDLGQDGVARASHRETLSGLRG